MSNKTPLLSTGSSSGLLAYEDDPDIRSPGERNNAFTYGDGINGDNPATKKKKAAYQIYYNELDMHSVTHADSSAAQGDFDDDEDDADGATDVRCCSFQFAPAEKVWLKRALAVYALVVLYLGVLYVSVDLNQRFNLPGPADNSTPATAFSEARALASLETLVGIALDSKNGKDEYGNNNIVGRMTMRPSGNTTAHYLLNILNTLKVTYGTDLQVDFTQTSGAYVQTGSSFAYSYESVQNVLGRVVGENDDIAVMVSAHYDSVAFSPGASDNGAAVAVALEVLQNLLALKASGEVLPVSVIFLFDDGEEAGLLGASAFTQHPWYQDVVTYVNLDSNGGWGRALLTQVGPQTEWLASVYASSVKYAEASAAVADIFAILPSGTNYELFASDNVAGIDIDLYRNDWTYHTRLDGLDDYQSGTLQAMGENTLDYLVGVAHSEQLVQTPQPITRNKVTATFFDILLGAVVAYDYHLATVLAGVSAATSVVATLAGGILYAVMKSKSTLGQRATKSLMLLVITFTFLLLTVILGLVMPGLVGLLLEDLNTFVWFSQLPIAVLGLGVFAIPFSTMLMGLLTTFVRCFMAPLYKRNFNGPVIPLEVSMVLCVNFLHILLLAILTLNEFGMAYLILMWTLSYNVASLWGIGYLIYRYRMITIESLSLDGYLNRRYEIIEGIVPAEVKNREANIKKDIFAIGLFYALWTILPTLMTMDFAWRFTLGITPQLGRLGVPNDALTLGAFWGIFQGLLAVLVLLPWLPLIQRMRHQYVLTTFFFAVGVVAFIVGAFLAPYTDVRPRRVDVVVFRQTELGVSNTTISLSAPNPGAMTDVTDAMTAYPSAVWSECEAPTYGYTYTKGLCLQEPIEVATLPADPTLTVQESSSIDNTWNVVLTITAPGAALSVFKFFDANLVNWSLPASIPVQGDAEGGEGSIYAPNGYAIVRRARAPSYNITLSFASVPDQSVRWELWSSYYATTQQQQAIIDDLPSWAQVWAKSNNPGPIALKVTGSFEELD